MRESNVLRQVWLAVAASTTLFRINTGTAWVSTSGKPYRSKDGAVIVPGGRPVTLGYGKPDGKPLTGTPDLGGWTSITITPEMVGQTVAVATYIETKRSDGGDRGADQVNFVDQVTRAGGIAGFAPSASVGQAIIADWIRSRGAKLT